MKFRKKPVVIEARQVPNHENFDDMGEYCQEGIDLAEWCDGTAHMMVNDDEYAYNGCEVMGPHISIKTLEGTMIASQDDWIIQGVQGEFYPCKPDIFEATYEKVED